MLALPVEDSKANDRIELIGVGELSGTASDVSGQSDKLENGEPHNRLGGFSALEYSGKEHRYVALPDRGPDDGATGYQCRYQVLDIDVTPGTDHPINLKLVDSVMLVDEQGRPFTGSSSAIEPTKSCAVRLDPEGFRFSDNGNFFVSDEYGPQLIEFTSVGKEVKRFQLPEHLCVANPSESKAEENKTNSTGRSSNKGMEGLAISPDKSTLIGVMQHVLLQDGERNEDGGVPVGVNCRIVQVDIATGDVKEFVYQLDASENGLNEILAVSPNEFLVIERDHYSGAEAKFKKIMKINLEGATEVQDIEKLPAGSLPPSIKPVAKQVLIDFLAPEFKLSVAQLPEKLEGLTLGHTLSDGRQTLLVASDNDFEAEAPSLIYVFALPGQKNFAAR